MYQSAKPRQMRAAIKQARRESNDIMELWNYEPKTESNQTIIEDIMKEDEEGK